MVSSNLPSSDKLKICWQHVAIILFFVISTARQVDTVWQMDNEGNRVLYVMSITITMKHSKHIVSSYLRIWDDFRRKATRPYVQ